MLRNKAVSHLQQLTLSNKSLFLRDIYNTFCFALGYLRSSLYLYNDISDWFENDQFQ